MSRDRFTASRYHLMSAAEKRAASLSVREPAVTCPDCDTQVMPADLLAHLEHRCPGPREPGPSSKWVTWREALALGVPKMTLSDWVRRGRVRMRGERGDRRYLLRDLSLRIVHWRSGRRR